MVKVTPALTLAVAPCGTASTRLLGIVRLLVIVQVQAAPLRSTGVSMSTPWPLGAPLMAALQRGGRTGRAKIQRIDEANVPPQDVLAPGREGHSQEEEQHKEPAEQCGHTTHTFVVLIAW